MANCFFSPAPLHALFRGQFSMTVRPPPQRQVGAFIRFFRLRFPTTSSSHAFWPQPQPRLPTCHSNRGKSFPCMFLGRRPPTLRTRRVVFWIRVQMITKHPCPTLPSSTAKRQRTGFTTSELSVLVSWRCYAKTQEVWQTRF